MHKVFWYGCGTLQRLHSCVLCSLLVFALPSVAEEFRGTVVAVLDEDTVEVLVDRQLKRVRLADIDAPEKGQAFGQRARQAASGGVAFGQTVRVVAKGQDRYGRTLGEVLLPDGSSLNKRLVHEGWAWQYKRYSDDRGLADLDAEAPQARRAMGRSSPNTTMEIPAA